MRTIKLVSIASICNLLLMFSTSHAQTQNTLQQVFENYFSLKDALVAGDFAQSQNFSKELMTNLAKVNTSEMNKDQASAWKKSQGQIQSLVKNTTKAKDIDALRKDFIKLSENMYALSKTFKYSSTMYLQRCPMYNNGKGATWLSKESNIKNPYYGSQMLTCGKVLETIK